MKIAFFLILIVVKPNWSKKVKFTTKKPPIVLKRIGDTIS